MVEFSKKIFNKIKRTLTSANNEIIKDIHKKFNVPMKELEEYIEKDNKNKTKNNIN